MDTPKRIHVSTNGASNTELQPISTLIYFLNCRCTFELFIRIDLYSLLLKVGRGMLTALAHPNHLLFVRSWVFARLSPTTFTVTPFPVKASVNDERPKL